MTYDPNDWPSENDGYRRPHILRIIAGLLLLVLLVTLLAIGLNWALGFRAAQAHDHWINFGGYVNPQNPKVHCCGQYDCPELSADDVEATPEGWHIKPLNETVPYSQTYTSEDGKFYRCHKADGSRRCFFAAGQGS